MNSYILKLLQILLFLTVLSSVSTAKILGNKSIEIKEKANEFLISKWTTEEGLPQNSVNDIIQTQDGYIWLATFGGLARFDGIKFTVFNTANTPKLTSNRILSLGEDKSGVLWIGTETGEIYTYADGEFQIFRENQENKENIIWDFHIDREGSFWIGTENWLEKFKTDNDGEVIVESAEIIPVKDIHKIYEDSNGKFWLVPNNKTFDPKTNKIETFNKDNLFRGFGFTKDKMWATTEKFKPAERVDIKLGTLDTDGFDSFIHLIDNKKEAAFNLLLAESNKVWFQYTNFILEINYPQAIKHDLKDFISNGARSILRDKDDNLWIGTNTEGLVRLKPKKISLLSNLTTSEIPNTFSVIQDSKGVIWIAGQKLIRFQDGKTNEFTPTNENDYGVVTTLAVDKDDNLWYGGYKLLGVHRDGKFETITSFQNKEVKSMFFDKNETLWIGTNIGLFKYENSEFTEYKTQDGLVNNQVHYITQTKDDSLWFGTAGGLSRLKNGKFENFTTADGLSNNFVREILEDKDGTIWLGTYGGGIVRFKNGFFKAITKEYGLHDDFISRILIDGEKFWILSNRGIFSLNRNELNEVADGTRKSLVYSIFGAADGMKTSEANGGFQYAGWKMKDGKLWFPMIDDMVIIDPKQINKNPPKIVIENVSFRGEKFDSTPLSQFLSNQKTLELDYGLENLEIEYTGLSFTKPEQIRFFYKLEGLDDEWVDAGTRRTAIYPYLPAGKYKFLVKAVNADGVSSQKEATLSINVASPFWQKWWFILLLVCALIALIVFMYQLRLKQLEKNRLRQQNFSKDLINAHEQERQRLASELHDGLGQNLLIIKNWALLAINNAKEEKVKNQLEEISETATNALDETRSIVSNLRPQNLTRFGLTEALDSILEQVEESTGVVFNKQIENIDNLFSDEAEISIYRIVQECVNNIIKHSESPRADVSIKRLEDEVHLVIEDFGKGFFKEKSNDAEHYLKGFGMTSISQRVNLLGGNLDINSAIDEGTRISIKIKM